MKTIQETKQNLLAENDILTSEDEGLRLRQQKNGIMLELRIVGKTAEETLEEAILAIQKTKETYGSMKKQGFKFQEQRHE